MTTQHTPTPWTQGGHDTNFAHAETYDDHIYDAMGNAVFQVVPANGSDDAATLTAFIVRACNAHEELLAYAECMEAYHRWVNHAGSENVPNHHQKLALHGWNIETESESAFLARLRQSALTKAEGK